MKKAIDFFTAHPARFFLVAALLWGGFMCFLDYRDDKFDWHDLLVEANGMVFDLLIFGILPGWCESPTRTAYPRVSDAHFNRKFQFFTSKPYAYVSKV